MRSSTRLEVKKYLSTDEAVPLLGLLVLTSKLTSKLKQDVEEKLWAMQLVTNSVVPDRWYASNWSLSVQYSDTDFRIYRREHTRTPPDKAEMASTTILKVKIVNGSGKVRMGGPGDEKKDIENKDLVESVWTGVVPMWETLGEPVIGGDGRLGDVPAHVRMFRDDTNEVNERYAKTAAKARS